MIHINRICMILFLTCIWCGILVDFSVINVITGLLLGTYCNLLLIRKSTGGSINLYRLFLLLAYVAYELVNSGIQLAWDILTPGTRSQPAILEIPTKCRNNLEKTVLANIISLTPGTITIDINNTNNTLIVHAMFARDTKKVVEFIQQKLETKVIRMFTYD